MPAARRTRPGVASRAEAPRAEAAREAAGVEVEQRLRQALERLTGERDEAVAAATQSAMALEAAVTRRDRAEAALEVTRRDLAETKRDHREMVQRYRAKIERLTEREARAKRSLATITRSRAYRLARLPSSAVRLLRRLAR